VVILCGFDIFLEDLSCKHIVNAFADFAITPFNPKTKSLLLFDTAAPLLQGCETLVVNSHQKCRPIGDW